MLEGLIFETFFKMLLVTDFFTVSLVCKYSISRQSKCYLQVNAICKLVIAGSDVEFATGLIDTIFGC